MRYWRRLKPVCSVGWLVGMVVCEYGRFLLSIQIVRSFGASRIFLYM